MGASLFSCVFEGTVEKSRPKQAGFSVFVVGQDQSMIAFSVALGRMTLAVFAASVW